MAKTRLPKGYRKFRSKREYYGLMLWTAFQVPIDVGVKFLPDKPKPRGDEPYIEQDPRPTFIALEYLNERP